MNSAACVFICGSQETKQMNSGELFIGCEADVFSITYFKDSRRVGGVVGGKNSLAPLARSSVVEMTMITFEIICISLKIHTWTRTRLMKWFQFIDYSPRHFSHFPLPSNHLSVSATQSRAQTRRRKMCCFAKANSQFNCKLKIKMFCWWSLHTHRFLEKKTLLASVFCCFFCWWVLCCCFALCIFRFIFN